MSFVLLSTSSRLQDTAAAGICHEAFYSEHCPAYYYYFLMIVDICIV